MNLPIIVSERDAARLRRLAQAESPAHAESIRQLRTELERARIVPETELPAGVITMNSTVELEDLEDGELLTCTLVFPENADAQAGKISILAPLGTAMLGFKVGDEFEWPVPAGTLRVRVRQIIQTPPAPHRQGTPAANPTTKEAA
jgi:regulator of nucleoside diphosphate kinase